MEKKIRVSKQLFWVCVPIIISFFMYFITANSTYLFLCNIIIMLETLIIAKFSIFSVKTIVLNWVLIAATFQHITGKSYGLLEMNLVTLYYKEMNIISLIYNIIMIIFISYSRIIQLEKRKLLNCRDKIHLKKFSVLLLSFIAIACSIIAFPRMPFTHATNGRFSALFKGNAWNHVAVVALLCLLPEIKKSRIVQGTYLLCIFWFLSHYERVDMMGVIVGCVIVLFTWTNFKDSNFKKIGLKKYTKYILVLITVVILLLVIGDMRNGGTFQADKLLRSIFVQKTASDIAYNFTCTVDYTINYGLLHGKTLLIYIVKLIPFTQNSASTSALIQNIYSTAGGDFLLDDAFINFGYIGVACFAILECIIIKLILENKSKYSCYLYLVLLFTVFRVTWYGYYYIEKAIFYFVPIMMGLSYFTTTKHISSVAK